MSTRMMLTDINREDGRVAEAVRATIPKMTELVDALAARMKDGGRLFYIGAGTSGRLAVTDASELPPTYGIGDGVVIALIAGGDGALRKAAEHAEDDTRQAWRDMQPYGPTAKDSLIGVAASGTTPYVIGGLHEARAAGMLTACITCNHGSPLALEADYALEAITGPEFVTGSTRMKAGTAEKMMLNMISTTLMIHLGRVEGNRMVNMQLSNNKLMGRGERMLMEQLGVTEEAALTMLEKYGSVKAAMAAMSAMSAAKAAE
jgi:N-acetylmuramic acid 6-phosphate etherase